jgi:CBS domain-containing protein
MVTVKQLMEQTGQDLCTISSDDTVFSALQLMAGENVGAVMVEEKDRIVGIFTERDYARKIILKGRCSLDTKLTEIMTHEMITVHPDQTLEECMTLMTKWHIRHLPVMSEGRLVGMISMRDVVQVILTMKDRQIEDLKSYIFGEEYPK